MSPNSPSCPFCAHELLEVLVEDGTALVALDRHPINRGHMLVIPRRHSRDLSELTDEEAGDVGRLARRADAALRAALGDEVTGTTLWMTCSRLSKT